MQNLKGGTMQYFILIWQTINHLFPLIIQTVQVIEQAFPEGGQGKAKLDLVRGALETAYKAESETQLKFEQLWPTLQTVVAGIVNVFNVSGAFKKAPTK